ncbi:MAG: stage 0 sporulation protein [Bacilli bacterium]|nr:stage 0 sporulation protein [Bacilli bacterium]
MFDSSKPNTPQEEVINNDPYFLGIRFNESSKSYFFSCKENTYKLNDNIVVETARGLELGICSIAPMPMSCYKLNLSLKPIIRLATEEDLKLDESNKELAKESFKICAEEIANLKLDMNLTSCEYTLDRSKVIFNYLANERVDFRVLLTVLAAKLKKRIELRQIGTRDKAKLVGGLGVCGLQLCCATFLNEFDGISINRAKNQMLSLNIPKLSGHCDKLICCLKFEDDTYTEAKKEFPHIGFRFFMNNIQYKVTSVNIMTKVVKIESQEDIQFIHIDELKKYLPKDYNKHE